MRAIVVLVLALAGCTKPAPVYITAPLPPLPAECEALCPAEPKLPDQDISDVAAARDRNDMKRAFRCEAAKRRVCVARLKVLLPQEPAP